MTGQGMSLEVAAKLRAVRKTEELLVAQVKALQGRVSDLADLVRELAERDGLACAVKPSKPATNGEGCCWACSWVARATRTLEVLP